MLLTAAILFRLPLLLNARGVHSDAAIVGLQAEHMLRGEWEPFLWGVRYQGSVDAVLVAAGFAVAGRSALVLMLVPFLGYLMVLAIVFQLLRKDLTPWRAAVIVLPIVFTPAAINGVIAYAPRQWSITAVFAATALFDGAAQSRRPWLRFAFASFLGTSSLYLDLFAAQLLPGVGVFALLCCGEAVSARVARRRVAWCCAGLLVAGALIGLVHLVPSDAGLASPAPPIAALAVSAPPRVASWRLLVDTCLPSLLAAKVFIPGASLYPDLWRPHVAVRAAQALGALVLLGGVLAGPVVSLRRHAPPRLRRLGLLGLTVTATALFGFVASGRPTDVWSTRYLAPILWTAPFSLAALAGLFGARSLALALAPYTISSAVGGWLGFGAYVNGPRPVIDARGAAQDEAALASLLRRRGVEYGEAQYWLSYRLTFLFDERPMIAPLDPREDRYPPYRRGFASAPTVAYIFHPSEPRARAADWEPWLRAQGGRVERLEVGGFTVLLHTRQGPDQE